MVQYIEHIFQQFVNFKFVAAVLSVGKKWLFWFCEALVLCVGAKPNVPFVRLAFMSFFCLFMFSTVVF